MKIIKIISLLIFTMLIITSFALNSIGTVTLDTNDKIIDDTHGTVIDFNNDWIDFTNASFTNNVTIDGKIINNTNISNWDTAYGWGDHSIQNYLDLDTFPNADTDSTDDLSLDTGNITFSHNDTFIKNSNGKYWSPSGSNFVTAYNDLSNGGKLFLPSGEFIITSDLSLLNNTVIEGINYKETVIILASTCTNGLEAVSGDYRHNITLRNLKIDAQCNATQCLYLTRCYDVTIENVWLNGSTYDNFYSEYDNRRWTINNLKVTGMSNPTGTSLFGIDLVNLYDSCFENIYIFDSVDSLGMMDLSRSENITINNLHIMNAFSDGLKIAGIVSAPSRNINLNNIYLTGFKDNSAGEDCYAFYTAGYVYNLNVNNMIVDKSGTIYIDDVRYGNFNNIYVNNTLTYGTNVAGHGIVFITSYHCNLNNFHIYDVKRAGLYLSSCHNLTLSNGDVVNSVYRGCVMENCIDVTFDSVNFLNGDSHGAELISCSHFIFDKCKFAYNTYDGIDSTSGACNNYSIVNCMFDHNNGGIDMSTTDDWVYLAGNFFYDDTVDQNAVHILPATPSDYNFGYSGI